MMNAIVWLIIACEIGFWVLLLAGLAVRYIAKKERLGFLLLALTPVVDLILLTAAAIDLLSGAVATPAHGIAAIYIGVSLAFGKSMIAWADERFQYYILKGAKPKQRYGYAHARHTFMGWVRHLLAFVFGASLLVLTIWLVDSPERTEALWATLKTWAVVLGADFLFSASYFIWPKEQKGIKEERKA